MSELNARLDLPLGHMAPAGARKTLRQLLITWGYVDGDWLDSACLVMAELVTNAVLHGGGCLEVAVQAHEETIMISAADGSSIVPRRKRGQRSGGLGLVLIERLSTAWWVENHQGGKRVWIRLMPYPRVSDSAASPH